MAKQNYFPPTAVETIESWTNDIQEYIDHNPDNQFEIHFCTDYRESNARLLFGKQDLEESKIKMVNTLDTLIAQGIFKNVVNNNPDKFINIDLPPNLTANHKYIFIYTTE